MQTISSGSMRSVVASNARTAAAPRSSAAASSRSVCRHRSNRGAKVAAFMPPQLAEIAEPAARRMAERMRREPIPLQLPGIPATSSLDTAYVPPAGGHANKAAPPVVLLHGFDSSSLEMRRLHPLLDQEVEAWAVDLVGWGFTDHSPFASAPDAVLTPAQKRAHLFAFWREKVRRPMVLVGASLGGAVALDFALEHPEAVERVALIDAQGFIDGIGPMASLPRPLAAAGVWLLRTEGLRMAANRQAYHDQGFATEDAMRVGRLHTHLDGWADANIAFMRGGGYAISQRLGGVQQPVLVLWGREDKILEPSYAQRFVDTLPDARLQWLEGCGHCGHLERPLETAAAILRFAGADESSVSSLDEADYTAAAIAAASARRA